MDDRIELSKNGDGKKKFSEFFYRIKRKVLDSFFIKNLNNFSSKVVKAVNESVFGHIISGHGKTSEYVSKSATGRLIDSINNSKHPKTNNFRQKNASFVERSLFINLYKKMINVLLISKTQNFGAFVLFFGLGIILTTYIKTGFPLTESNYLNYAVGIILTVSSVPAIAKKSNVAEFLLESMIFRVVAKVFYLNTLRLEELSKKTQNRLIPFAPLIFGVLFAFPSYFISPLYIILGVAIVIYATIVLLRPEYGLMSLFVFIPFLPTMYLLGILSLTLLSMFVKVTIGKRVVKYSLIDLPILLFTVSTIASGFITKSGTSFKKMLLCVCVLLGYFITKNLLKNTAHRLKCMSLVSFSSAVVSVIGIIEYFIGKPATIWQDMSQFEYIKGRVISTFDNPNILGEFLLIAIPFSLIVSIVSDSKTEKLASFTAFILDVSCLILTWSRGAWLSFAISIVILLVFINKKWITALILLIPPAGVLAAYTETGILKRFISIFTFNDTSAKYRLGIFESTIHLISKYGLFGTGLGTEAFSVVYPVFAVSGTQAALHSHNLYLQTTAEQGLLGIISLIAVIFMFIRMCGYYQRTSATSTNKRIIFAIFIAFVSLLIMGFTDYIWYSNKIFMMFWLLIGLGTAHIEEQKTNEIVRQNDIIGYLERE